MKVLVVDGDTHFLAEIAALIRQWGYGVERAASGGETLAKIGTRPYDLVLLDTALPDMKVQDLIPQIKGLRPETGIVTMTGANTGQLENEIRTLGIVYYMSKPINEEVLKEILDHISKKKRRIKDGPLFQEPLISKGDLQP